jgi:hypothetical protein
VWAGTPAALQLRLLQTMVEVAAEKNSTLVLPFPVEMLRYFEAITATGQTTGPPDTRGGPASPPLAGGADGSD